MTSEIERTNAVQSFVEEGQEVILQREAYHQQVKMLTDSAQHPANHYAATPGEESDGSDEFLDAKSFMSEEEDE